MITSSEIETAKRKLEKRVGGTPRQWLMATPPDSYGDPRYRVELYVYQGSPPKGYILVSYGIDTILIYNHYMKLLWKIGGTEVEP